MQALRADLDNTVPGSRFRQFANVVLVPRVRALVQFRSAAWCARHSGFRLASTILQARILRSCAAEISPKATLGPGICLVHTTGIVIGDEVIAGRNLRLYQGVTIGNRSGRRQAPGGQPVIGEDGRSMRARP